MVPPGSVSDDVRVYDLEAQVSAPSTKANLNFTCAARQKITQEIPIRNGSDVEWSLQVALASPSKVFKGATNLKVPPGETANYVVTFSPPWICEETASLSLKKTC